MRLTSTVPDPAELPAYVTGGGAFVPAGVVRTNLAIFAPADGSVVSVSFSGSDGELPVLSQRQGNVPVALTTVSLDPGRSTELAVELLTAKRTASAPTLRTTPGSRELVPSIDVGCAANS
ncbi:hypothetical protein [Litorihabitans aurantiacus]|uniref:hypothetical protein n=1 Tax=Litorihabitans aurantiacus TaxID=1930061 RepID=UPI0024E18F16|nr:hypothetical protein [Litorihabitans aurantiacus]